MSSTINSRPKGGARVNNTSGRSVVLSGNISNSSVKVKVGDSQIGRPRRIHNQSAISNRRLNGAIDTVLDLVGDIYGKVSPRTWDRMWALFDRVSLELRSGRQSRDGFVKAKLAHGEWGTREQMKYLLGIWTDFQKSDEVKGTGATTTHLRAIISATNSSKAHVSRPWTNEDLSLLKSLREEVVDRIRRRVEKGWTYAQRSSSKLTFDAGSDYETPYQ
ncbi:uncharacterized protein EV422DRAFT_567239 [Fimicolochytrium jonesii]|uniref:uncharacterized protein n=1 Tax=Fimicolochytrium jonesii TaxID=1396493 RepID=UPI0022FE82AC|nr:uncharacterized protein EV422DRAFT_567239 [Fimicolochytrium jonesii]KAI8821506.1 hypothetical protein EV422DRAFT_567239 [Fimicolochytrium jonesii]